MRRRARAAQRRTDPATLAAVELEVEAMVAIELRGPASLLAERLAKRGIAVSVSTLRAGDCRPLLERVWVRRPRSMRSFGPTGGHDMRRVGELVEHAIDLKCRIGRVRADISGKDYDRNAEVERDPRSLAVCAKKAAKVREMASLIEEIIPKMAAQGVVPTFKTVAEAMTERGHSLHHRTMRRNDEYSALILKFHMIPLATRPPDPERALLSRLSSEELGAMIVGLQAELRMLDAEFLATLAG